MCSMNLSETTITSDGDKNEYWYNKGKEAAANRKQKATTENSCMINLFDGFRGNCPHY